MTTKSITEAAGDTINSMAKRTPLVLLGLAVVVVLGLVSYGVPSLFANEGNRKPLLPPVLTDDSVVTQKDLRAGLAATAAVVLEAVRSDLKSERAERLETDKETRRLLETINQRIIDLSRSK